MSASSSTPTLAGRAVRQRARRRRALWIGLPLALVLVAGGYFAWRLTRGGRAAVAVTTGSVTSGSLSVTVAGSGTVEPAQSRAMAFAVSGTVAEVLVGIGDKVTAGQPLARLDTTELDLAVKQAEANLASAKASVAAANGQGATAEEIAGAETQLASAKAQLRQTQTGGVTKAQLASAEAQLASAKANLAQLLAGPTADTLASAQTSVEQARLNLEAQRVSLSAAKTKAEGAMATAANSLRDAQDSYSTIYWQNRQLEKLPGELPQANKDNEAAAKRAVANAEESLKQAQLAYEQAKDAEATGLAQAESQLKAAETQLATVEDGATDAELASARASVASAQANLDALKSPATPEQLAIAQASVEQAQLSLDKLVKPGSETAVASAAAGLAQAEVALETARLNLERATLVAPFAGVVSEVAISAGDSAAAGSAVTVIDPSTLYVDLNLSESDVAGVAPGQPVELTFDALDGVTIKGGVERVAPAATVTSNVATYPVRVTFKPGDAAIKVGMSASGTIIVETREGAVMVPSRAVVTMGERSMVRVQQAEGQPPTRVEVETGLTSDGKTEILRCVETGDMCLQAGDTVLITTASATGTTGNTTRAGNLGGGGFGGPGFSGPPPGAGGRP